MNKALTIVFLLFCLLTHKRAEGSVNFPATLDDNTTLHNIATGDVYIASFHNDPKDAVLALEAKVGANNSAVVTSLDYLVKSTSSVDPGHKHTGTSLTFADGSVGTPALRFGNPLTDTTSGWFHPSTGILAFSSSGSEVIRITAAGIGVFNSNAGFPIDLTGIMRIRGTGSLCYGGTGAADQDVCLARTATRVLTLTGALVHTDQAAGDTTVELQGFAAKTGAFLNVRKLPADANTSFRLAADGVTLGWGAGGASALDTFLTRTSAALLGLTGSLTASGDLTAARVVVGVGTIALVNGSNNDIALPTAQYTRITGPTGAFTITGVTAGTSGQIVTYRNTTVQTFTIANESASSSVANRITTLTTANLVCNTGGGAAVTLLYDGTAARWVVIASPNCV